MPPNTPSDTSSLDKTSDLSNNPAYNAINTNVKCLFDPREEKAACGVGFIVNIDGIASHKVNYCLFFFCNF
jgi:hypothetical protein